MELKFVTLDGIGVIVCEHCYGTLLAFKPIKDFMLPMTYCPDCRKNSKNEVAPPPPEFMKV
jgi:hypothetical protein